ncbi:MAG TPA: phage holin family protein [Candidatus Limnocylindrales bacterium]|nr:phage holin family protein [Candidatus Limnocylindrales bacterium]
MRGFLIRWFINAIALGLTSWLVKGIDIQGLGTLLIASLVLGILNALLRPIILLLTLPLNILTLGLFTFVVNAFMLMMASKLVEGFVITDFWSALVGAIILSIISFFISVFIGNRGVEYIFIKQG